MMLSEGLNSNKIMLFFFKPFMFKLTSSHQWLSLKKAEMENFISQNLITETDDSHRSGARDIRMRPRRHECV